MLSDTTLVASCIPGATLTAVGASGAFGLMRVQLGGTLAVFRGDAEMVFDHELRRCTLEIRGIDNRGDSRVTASGIAIVSGDEVSVLSIKGSVRVSGPLERPVDTFGQHIARDLLKAFRTNLAVLAAAGGEPVLDAGSIELVEPSGGGLPLAAAPIRGPRTLWRSAQGLLREALAGRASR